MKTTLRRTRASLWLIATVVSTSCNTAIEPTMASNPLEAIDSWGIQLQGLERPGAVAALRRAAIDLVVIEPTNSVRGNEAYPIANVVRELHASGGSRRKGKLVVAYLDIGQAEDYRTYWQPDWIAPTPNTVGRPDFLLALDPDGWPGNYPCKYWDPRWKRILFGSPNAMLDRILDAGFDGLYLDWILGYREPSVVEAAKRDGVDAAAAMVTLLEELRAYAKAKNDAFVLIAQNAAWLGDDAPGFEATIDALAHEDLTFRGDASAHWDDENAGGIDTTRERCNGSPSDPLLDRLAFLNKRGLPILTLDYAVRTEDVRTAHERSVGVGFVPTISRTPLDRLPPHVRTLAAPVPR